MDSGSSVSTWQRQRYGEIAQIMGITENTVIDYTRRSISA